MDERELRRTIEKEVGKLPDGTWRFLSDEGYLHIEGDEDVEALIETSRRALLLGKPVRRKATTRTRGPRSATNRSSPRPTLFKLETRRRDALSAYFAREAARHPDVRRFRADVLGDSLLTGDEARAWLKSPAVRTFPLAEFKRRGVDAARHRATLISQDTNPLKTYRAVIRIDDDRREWAYEEAVSPHGDWVADVILRDGSIPFAVKTGDETIKGRCRHESLLYRLVATARRTVLPGYPHGADIEAWFILTGWLPPVLAAENAWSGSDRATHRIAAITLEVAPWVSADTVVAAFRRMQGELLKRHNRPMSERRLTLFQFVTERTAEDGTLPTWRALVEPWNRRHRVWKYDDVRNMSRDYWATARQLLKPEYHFAH